MSDIKNIGEAIHAIYSEIGYVRKEGQVAFGNTKYKFAGEAAFIAALRPVMVKHGVTISVNDMEIVHCVPGHVIIKASYLFAHALSGTVQQVVAMGEGKDSGDKAIYKAMTGAYKYALRQTFMIETGDDPDNTSSEELVAKEKESNKPFKNAAERKRHYDAIILALDNANGSDDLERARAELIKPFADKVRIEEDEHWMQLLDQLTTRYLQLKKSFAEIEGA